MRLITRLLFIASFCMTAVQAQTVKVFLNTQVPEEGKFQGFQTVDIFEECPPTSDTCMSWLAGLRPEVVRFPSGGQAKFTHLTTGPGYGFDLEEIDAYFYDLFNCDEAYCGAGSNYEAAVNDWTQKCLAQDSLPGGGRYIDDFILMIQTLEAQLGYTIDVLFCLNIVTADAAENKEALDLLIANGIHVTGAEIGNETYSESNGFESFESYLAYVQNPSGAVGDQDYIGMIRQYFPDLKVGVCAAPPGTVDVEQGPGITYATPSEGKRIKYDDWNTALGSGWDSTRTISTPMPHTVPLYDAAVVHFYYKSSFWQDCAVQFVNDLDAYGGTCCPYSFDAPDPRLTAAFECFSAHGEYFRDSLYGNINAYYAERFQLNDPFYGDKKIWATEWNILEADNAPETTLFHNTLVQASVVFDWQHLAYQFNTSPLYNTGFQEYRTMHNAASVSYRNMITAKAAYEADPEGDTTGIRKRMFYHMAYLMRHIAARPVSTVRIVSTLPHVAMYGYLDEANEQLYIYYNNTGAENTDQQLRLNKIRLLPSPGCTAVIQYPVQQEYIQGQQLYSGAGVGYMYDIHPMYDAENTISSEISGSINRIFGGPKKIMLHKNSLGVLKVPVQITCSERLSDLTGHRLRIYPNPADQYVDIYPGLTDDRSETYVIELYDHTGRPIRRIVSGDEVYTLHRNDLPAGIYYIAVRYADGSHNGGKIVFQ